MQTNMLCGFSKYDAAYILFTILLFYIFIYGILEENRQKTEYVRKRDIQPDNEIEIMCTMRKLKDK